MFRLVAPTVIRQTQRRYEELGLRGHGPRVKKLSLASHTPVSGLADGPTSFEPSLINLLWRRLVAVLKTHRGRFGVAALLVVTTVATADELRTSRVQAWLFASIGNEVSFETAPGPSPAIRFPEPGPYDLRLGHARLPDFLARLETSGYVIDRQARSSDRLLSLIDGGAYPLYLEKPQAGLQIVDRDDRTLFVARYPERIYQGFDEIPPLVVQTVLFLENRELLDAQVPYRNPAIEWDRTVRAILHLGVRYVDPTFPRLGGSTLATQLEKIRHSPDGVTRSVGDKLRQITTASLRAYLGGRDTLEAQQRIVTDYLNSIPLAALPGHGEVIGLGDGLWAWYGTDFGKVNDLLRRADTLREGMDVETARVYRRVVSLLVAIRRPSDYLLRDAGVLASLTNDALDALGSAGVVRARLAALARTERPQLRRTVHLPEVSFFDRKPASTIRASLSATLGLDTVYELDRTDVTVTTTLDHVGQQTVAERLKRLADPAYAASAGLTGDRLLGGADPASVVYSLVLYERDGDANLVRIQADSLDQPLDVNAGTKLELGSTAKLRTLVSYLEIVATLHAAHAGHPPSEIAAALAGAEDPLTRRTLDHLHRHPDTALSDMLEAALERRYSASPGERFVTGGGVHTFGNFDSDDNQQTMSVREAFRRSVNLVFIRLMRDIVRYHTVRLAAWSPALIDDRDHPERARLLERFADREGVIFLDRFLDRYREVPPHEAVDALAARHSTQPRRLAAIHRSVYPNASVDELTSFLDRQLGTVTPPETVARLHRDYSTDHWSLPDRGHLAGVHPLELWLVSDLVQHGSSNRADVLSRGVTPRQDAYRWLFRTRHKSAQDRRIRFELERDAFVEIHRDWRRLGYPFDRLVPSYATAIGSSGDNPQGLSELMGIIQNGGRRRPMRRVAALRFAEGTPMETWLRPRVAPGVQVLDSTVATVLRRELVGVVEHGTGRRMSGGITLDDGSTLEIGGKTGTGDNRVKTRTGSTRRVLNRTATFTFLIGDRFFGTLMAYVDGGRATDYRFTSALPVQVLKHLVPTLRPIFQRSVVCDTTEEVTTAGTCVSTS